MILIANFPCYFQYFTFLQILRFYYQFVALLFRRAIFRFTEIIYAFLQEFQTPPSCIYGMKEGSSASLSNGVKSFTDIPFLLILFVFC